MDKTENNISVTRCKHLLAFYCNHDDVVYGHLLPGVPYVNAKLICPFMKDTSKCPKNEERKTMSMKNLPPSPFPEGVECHQQNDFTIEVIEPTIDEGRCEVCHDAMSTIIFDVGITHHHLCRDCFEMMMRTFAEKSNSVLSYSIVTPLQASR